MSTAAAMYVKMKTLDSSKQLLSPPTLKSNTTACSSSASSPPMVKHQFVERIGEVDSVAQDSEPAIVDELCSSSPPIIKGDTSKPSRRKRTTTPKTKIPALINLVKQKPIVKSPMFMNSTSSIFAA
eukprot:scaffold5481_cov197-Skeletonema_marinoi.AAC.1